MNSKDEYRIEMWTNKDLGSQRFVVPLLTQWWNEVDPELRPDRFGLNEPVRRRCSEEGVQSAIDLWLTRQRPVMLKRVSRPQFIVDIDWRPTKGFDRREFPWGCFVWLSFSAGDNLALKLLHFLIRRFVPAFGLLTTSNDLREKHLVAFQDRVGRVEQYVGLRDVGNRLPGVYWATYFGPWAVDRIGQAQFQTLPAHKMERVDDGVLVLAYPSSTEATKAPARASEGAIKEHLGADFFFDKGSVDIGSMKTSPEDAKTIEERVAEKKRQKAKKGSQ